MNEIDIIKSIIDSNPRNFSKMIKKQPELVRWVQANSKVTGQNFSAEIYSAITGSDNICALGNKKPFASITQGWKFCGNASNCACAKQAVSEKVKISKSQQSAEQKALISEKRKNTNLAKYGVINAGQTERAKQQHKNFYQDSQLVEQSVQQQRQTMLLKYGVLNPAELAWVKYKKTQTMQEKYGVNNPMQHEDIKNKSVQQRLLSYNAAELLIKNFAKFQTMLQNAYGVCAEIDASEYVGVASRPEIKFKCLSCNWSFEKRFDYAAPPICKVCNPTPESFQSKEEVDLVNYIKSNYSGTIITRDRSTINPYEIDILLPDLNLAFEYCGLYWHSEISGNKTWNYHAKKYQLSASKGIRLITIFSDEWLYKTDIVKEKIKNLLGARTHQRLGARQCQIEIIDVKTARLFHEQYHIQGGRRNLGINISLKFQGDTVLVASFVREGDQYELVRLSSSRPVAGGASKVLKHFGILYPGSTVISFSDSRWSSGDLYKQLGFEIGGYVAPMQSYVKNNQRYHKLLFPKHKINPAGENKTEWQIMQEQGYDRIWDCGKIKWVKVF